MTQQLRNEANLISEALCAGEAEAEVPARQDDGVTKVAHADDAVGAAVVVIIVVVVLRRSKKLK